MELNRKTITESVEITTVKSEGVGFILVNPATFKIGDVAYKLALQGGGLSLVAVEKPDTLVNIDLSAVLGKAAEEIK
jgi:hypothetical protein